MRKTTASQCAAVVVVGYIDLYIRTLTHTHTDRQTKDAHILSSENDDKLRETVILSYYWVRERGHHSP